LEKLLRNDVNTLVWEQAMMRVFLTLLFLLAASHRSTGAETLDSLVTGAKKESELTFIAGAQTFRGTKTLSALEAAFNKKFGLNARIRFAAGPEMNAMAARVIT
jgi:predicted amino acid-binding ACT domain protein